MQALLRIFHRALPDLSTLRVRYALRLLLLALCLPLSSAWAFISSPPGSSFDLAGGTVDMMGTDLVVEGVLVLGPGGRITGIRNLIIAPGGQLNISGGDMELSQQYTNQGEVINDGGGHITRVDGGPGNPIIGPPGPIVITPPAATSVTPVPGLAGGPLLALSLILGLWACLRQRSTRNGQPAQTV